MHWLSLKGGHQVIQQNSNHAKLSYVRGSTEVKLCVHVFGAAIAISEGLLFQLSRQMNSFSCSKSTFKLLVCICKGLQLVT